MWKGLFAKIGCRQAGITEPMSQRDVADRVAWLRAKLKSMPRDDLGNLAYPDDDSETAAWFPVMAEVCQLTGQPAPRWPTRRSLNEEIARCAAALAPSTPKPAALQQLDASVAAQRFVAWLLQSRRSGSYDSERLSQAYRQHCDEERLMPCPEETLRKHLLDVDGVRKSMVEAGKVGTRRKRSTQWVVAAPKATVIAERAIALAA